ncbi:MAG: hypothetical protein RSA68_03745 [Hafnia sp.]|uniref:hypothetical protein n=1 Tax=Hafnia sp. TaxID=1873498 RepID=UPI002FC9377C
MNNLPIETYESVVQQRDALEKKLLAYEQAAKNPVAFVDERSAASGGICWAKSGKRELPHGTELYAVPVLPKQPELVDLSQQVEILNRILNWILKELPVPTQKASAMAIRLSSVIDIISDLEVSAPAQPVIPEQPDSQDLELYIDMLENSDSDAEDGELNNTQLIVWLKELQRRRALSAQPVSDPYKLPDGWKLVPIEPTAAMFHAFNDCDYGRKSMRERYIQMIEAAPAQESE